MLLKNAFTSFIFTTIFFVLLFGWEKDSIAQYGNSSSAESKAPKKKPNPEKMTDGVMQIDWAALIPERYRPDGKLIDLYEAGKIKEDDPRIIALKKKFKELKEKAPVNVKLDGKKIKIPGFVVPLETDGKIVREFLLVPYHGACVHVPPPPANQIIYVKTNKNSATELKAFDVIWATGIMKVVKTKTKVAATGFTLYASKIKFYE